MRVAENDYDDRGGWRGYGQLNEYIITYTHTLCRVCSEVFVAIIVDRPLGGSMRVA